MSELSRPVAVARLEHGPFDLTIEAGEPERHAMAERLGVQSVVRMKAAITVRKHGARLTVTGRYDAEIERICVITLEPFVAVQQGEIDEEFLRTDDPENLEVIVDETTLEPLTEDVLDVGEIVVQHVSLDLDPHPRAEGVEVDDLDYDPDPAEGQAADSPFAALQKLRSVR